jgi:bifunctional non-homologous end joining protein LigD
VEMAKQPDFIDPQLATLADAPPTGPKWVHEVKFDGYRTQIHVEKGKVRISTRRGHDWSNRFKAIAKAASALPDCIIDGEAVVLDAEGRSDFSALQSALASGKGGPISLYAFDLLFLKGLDLRSRPLLERKGALRKLLAKLPADSGLRYSEHFTVPGEQMRKSACAMGLEGVVSKRINAPYRSTRNEDWIKSKCGERETFIIGGWRQAGGGMQSIALGEFRNGKLYYVGKARTGFQDMQRELLPQLTKVERATIPFNVGRPQRKEGQHWCEPVLHAEVSFTAWTASRHIRQAKFLGLRQDMPTETKRHKVQPSSIKRPTAKNIQRLLEGAAIPPADQLKAYWGRVGKKALRYLAGRPLTLVRTDGKRVFFHTGSLPPLPKNVHALTIEKREGGTGTRLWVDSVPGLVALVDLGVIEVHPWNSTVANLEHPDQMIFDLDPGEGIPWEFVTDTALMLRDWLKKEEGLASWPKATGGKGLHVMVPLDGKRDDDEARQHSKEIATRFAALDRRYTVTAGASQRVGKLFLDYLRNGRGQTGVGAYSPRARKGHPIAVPLTWREVRAGVRSDEKSLATAR